MCSFRWYLLCTLHAVLQKQISARNGRATLFSPLCRDVNNSTIEFCAASMLLAWYYGSTGTSTIVWIPLLLVCRLWLIVLFRSPSWPTARATSTNFGTCFWYCATVDIIQIFLPYLVRVWYVHRIYTNRYFQIRCRDTTRWWRRIVSIHNIQ